MPTFFGNTILDAAPSTGGVIPVITADGVRGMTVPAALAALIEGAAGVTVNGVSLNNGTLTLPAGPLQIPRGTTTGQVAIGLGATSSEGYQIGIIDETVSHVGNAALSIALTGGVIPAQSVIMSVQINLAAALTGGGTTVKAGVGIAGTPSKYGLTGDLLKNTKKDTIPTHAVLASPETLGVYACATGGTAGNTALTVGAVRVRIVYATLVSLANAP